MMRALDFTRAQERTYDARLDRVARRAALHAEKASELQARFIAAALGPDTAELVPTPGLPIKQRSIADLLHNEIDGAQLAALLRDAAQGRDVKVQASLLLSVLACQFAQAQADYALEAAEDEGELEDGPDPDEAYERRRDEAMEGGL
jgi:methionine synthase I (cobalamin-dependent)